MNKTLITTLLTLSTLSSTPTFAGWEFSLGHDFYKHDEVFNIERKGLPGIAVGYGFGTGTYLRTHYLGGDMYVGSENVTMQHLRLDVEQDLYRGWKYFTPYAVMGISHREFDFNNTPVLVNYSPKIYAAEQDITATYLSAGFGFRIPLGESFRFEADHRVMVDDNIRGLGYDGSMTSVRVSYLLGSKPTPAAVVVAPIVAPIVAPVVAPVSPTLEKLTVFFPTNAYELDAFSKSNIRNFVGAAVVGKTVKLVVATGYASSPGSAEYNMQLSAARAQLVATYIQTLLPEANIEILAMGEELADQKTHNEADQKTEITIIVE